MSRRNKLIGLLVGCWLAVGFVPVAQADLAEGEAAYLQGNYDTAFKEFKSLAERGLADAQYNLGVMYDSGNGVQQDYVLAYMWYTLAETRGDEGAIKNRGLVAAEMTREQIAEAQRLAREWKPNN